MNKVLFFLMAVYSVQTQARCYDTAKNSEVSVYYIDHCIEATARTAIRTLHNDRCYSLQMTYKANDMIDLAVSKDLINTENSRLKEQIQTNAKLLKKEIKKLMSIIC
jgi:hypothetical protein